MFLAESRIIPVLEEKHRFSSIENSFAIQDHEFVVSPIWPVSRFFLKHFTT